MSGNSVEVGAEPLERVVWLLWFQGADRAPEAVRRTLASWERANPGWDVRLLDESTVREWVDVEVLDGPRLEWLDRQHRSDLVRLSLLRRHGGVWADATCLCVQPLGRWIDGVVSPSGFFAFTYVEDVPQRPTLRPSNRSPIANWFLAARKQNHIVENLFERLMRYWSDHDFSNHRVFRGSPRVRSFLDNRLSLNAWTATLWFSPVIARGLRLWPQYSFHYQFTKLLLSDPAALSAWRAMPKLDARRALLPQALGLSSFADDPGVRAAIATCEAPVFKMNWREPLQPGSVYDFATSRWEGEPAGQYKSSRWASEA